MPFNESYLLLQGIYKSSWLQKRNKNGILNSKKSTKGKNSDRV